MSDQFYRSSTHIGEANAKEQSLLSLESLLSPVGVSRAGESKRSVSSEAACQSRRTGSAPLTIKKNIFKSWHVFRGRKVCLQEPQKHHKSTTKEPQKHHQKNSLFPDPPAKMPSSAALKTNAGRENMVEAVGVEPTSEKTSNRELSCFFQFIFVSSSPLRTDEDAATTSLISLIRPAQTEQGRPAYCATIGTGP